VYIVVPYEDIPAYLKAIYASPKFGLCGRDRFYSKIQRMVGNISRTQVAEFLKRQEGHQMTMPMRKVPIVRPVVSGAPFRHWQMDLVDFQALES